MDENDHDDDDNEQWTPAALDALQTATRHLVETLSQHNAALNESIDNESSTFPDGWFEAVAAAGLKYAEAHFELTGTSGPFALFHEFEDEDEDDDEEEDDMAAVTDDGQIISVLQRSDYRVVHEANVIAAGRDELLGALCEESRRTQAASRVESLGTALYEFAHVRGWHSLTDMSGLDAIGSVIRVIAQASESPSIVDEFEEEPFIVAGSSVFTEENVYFDRD
ncbi:hypothetical protein QN345_02310 [Cryobacterium sp. 10I1]|uniref:hypothetical protein n=1 Tax=Cryobacterium sp. 10I1 TaxID=3048578 RepID=UPI002B22F577|nr:hypothetical protein [Cryobacterium sp. 10I1]MEB0304169.1 hypothetical protein [Cryobacterium sp. 10I1]